VVYLDAFTPEDGESLLDILPDPIRIPLLEATAQEGEGWMVPPISAEVFNVNASDREWVNRQCTMHPIGTLRQSVKLSGRSKALKSPTFILATDFDNSYFTAFYDRARARGWRTLTMPGGHDLMLDRPAELTGALIEIAETQLV
jgi:pimeloyl-ACP methyl ester carboxylesterase